MKKIILTTLCVAFASTPVVFAETLEGCQNTLSHVSGELQRQYANVDSLSKVRDDLNRVLGEKKAAEDARDKLMAELAKLRGSGSVNIVN